MKTLVLTYWDRIRTSFWFLPSLMALAAAVFAFVMVWLDTLITDEWKRELGWAYSGGAEGASVVLGTIAGSMITIAGVVFSLTLVALSLASSQFGPRLLRNFMRDTSTQFVLGVFLATFLYCLLVLRTVRRVEEIAFVPHLSVSVGVLFALASVGVLIYYIHHVSMSIQADEVIAGVGRELLEKIDDLVPSAEDDDARQSKSSSQTEIPNQTDESQLPAAFDRTAVPILSKTDGYLQYIDLAALKEFAIQHDVVLRVHCKPGDYLVRDQPLLQAWPAKSADDNKHKQLQSAFILGIRRTPTQDLEFGILQLVEMAVRALSPGINDPFTAITCIDWLGSALSRLASRPWPSNRFIDDAGQLRIEAHHSDFAGVVDAAFLQIRQNGKSTPAVAIRLLEALQNIATFTTAPDRRAPLRRHADLVIADARNSLDKGPDLDDVEHAYQNVLRTLALPF